MNTDRVNFRKLFRDVGMHVDVGLKLYRAKRTEDDAIFFSIFEKLDSTLKQTQEHLEYLSANVAKYDFVGSDGRAVKGSGYRSVLYFAACILEPLHESLLKAAKSRSSFRFSASEHINSLYLHCSALQGLEQLAGNSRILMEATPAPQLFNVGEVKWKLVRASIVNYLSRDIFFGRLFAVQYPSSVRSVLKMLGIGMASYEQWYHGEKDEKSKQVKQILTSLWKGSHYLKSPTRLGLKLDGLTNDCSVHFVKAFWSLADQTSFQSAMRMLSQSVKIRHHLEVPSKDLKVPTVGGGEVEINPPSVHIGYKPISLLLLSSKWRGSQPCGYATKKQSAPLSPGLVVHIHGGGYVAQSPQSHESYLRHWAVELDVPVVSIDYSLSPEAPYPRALEECVMAYCWILQNFDLLGTTGERIMLVGDSAGGNFAITTAMKLKLLDIRLPDSILIVYPSTDVRTSACPSRIMSLVDPILPLGVMVACQQAYSNTLPVSEELSLRKEYRRRIMRAQGYYLPDPDTKSPSWKEKRSSRRGRTKSASAGSSQNTDKEMTSMTEKPKVAPQRPPPPSFYKPKLQAASSSDGGASNGNGGASNGDGSDIPAPPLEAMMEEVSLGEDIREDSLFHSKIPVCFQQEPEQRDVLSPSEFEELIEEMLKTFQDGDVTRDPFMSPVLATDEQLSGMPPVHIIGAGLDSLLDDAVAMAQRLKMARQPVTLDVLDGLFHGFLVFNVAGKNTEINLANKLCLDYIRTGLNIDFQDTKK